MSVKKVSNQFDDDNLGHISIGLKSIGKLCCAK